MKSHPSREPVFYLMRSALWAVLGMVCLASAPAPAENCGGVSCRCMDCDTPASGGGGVGSDDSRPSSRDREYSQRIDKANKLLREAKAAARADNAHAALRLAREAQAMADDYKWLSNWVRQLENYIAQEGERQRAVAARKVADAAREEANAAYDRGDWRAALVLYQRALATDTDSLSDYGKKRVKDLDQRLKKETEAAERERLHRPEVERLRAESRTLMDLRPAAALAKLDAALKLLPEDTKTSGDWWFAKANLDFRGGKYDEALQALQNAQNFSGELPEIARARAQVADERKRQGVVIESGFSELRQRLAAAARADPVGVDAGAQLKSVDHHGRQAQAQGNDTDKDLAREGFDTLGTNKGNLVAPDKSRARQVPPSVLDRQIPRGAMDDPEVRKMQAWYRSLDAKKAEKEKMIAEIDEQQKSRKDPALDAKKATLANDVKRLDEDQTRATATVSERVTVIRKQMLDKGLAWDESPAPDAADKPVSAPAPASSSSQLDFIRN